MGYGDYHAGLSGTTTKIRLSPNHQPAYNQIRDPKLIDRLATLHALTVRSAQANSLRVGCAKFCYQAGTLHRKGYLMQGFKSSFFQIQGILGGIQGMLECLGARSKQFHTES